MSQSEIIQLAENIGPIITPYLPYLIKGVKELGKGIIKKSGELLTEEGWKKAHSVWKLLFPEKDKKSEKNKKEFIETISEKNRDEVTHELMKVLRTKSNKEIIEIFELLGGNKKKTVLALGERSIAIGGNVNDSTIISGDTKKENAK